MAAAIMITTRFLRRRAVLARVVPRSPGATDGVSQRPHGPPRRSAAAGGRGRCHVTSTDGPAQAGGAAPRSGHAEAALGAGGARAQDRVQGGRQGTAQGGAGVASVACRVRCAGAAPTGAARAAPAACSAARRALAAEWLAGQDLTLTLTLSLSLSLSLPLTLSLSLT